MTRKRGRAKKEAVPAVPDEILAEGSGPHDPDMDAGEQPVHVRAEAEAGADVAPDADVVFEAADQVAAAAVVADEAGDVIPEGPEAPEAPEAPEPHEASEVMDLADAAGDLLGDADHELSADGEPALDGASEDAELALDGEVSAELDASASGDGEGEDAEIAGAVMPTSAASMEPLQFKQLVEALVFASDKPLTLQRLRQLTRVSDVRRLEQTLVELAADYETRGLVLQQVSGGYQFRTRSQFSPWVQQLIAGRPVRLSRAQLETLAIIAYRQPITRPEIDDIRGVDSSATLKLLIDRALIRVLGKREEVGRPMLYGTTKEFLDFFSLGDLRELPTLREYSELSDESRKVMSARLGVGLDEVGSASAADAGSDDDGSDGGGSDGGGGFDGGGSDGGGFDGGAGGGSGPIDDGSLDDDGATHHAGAHDAAPVDDEMPIREGRQDGVFMTDMAMEDTFLVEATSPVPELDATSDDHADVGELTAAFEDVLAESATSVMEPLAAATDDAQTRELDEPTETVTVAEDLVVADVLATSDPADGAETASE